MAFPVFFVARMSEPTSGVVGIFPGYRFAHPGHAFLLPVGALWMSAMVP